MDNQHYPGRRGPGLVPILIFCTGLIVIIAVGITGLQSSNRASNERNASTSLKTLTSAEADFRANDRDWNHINDFWTADVKGLYTMTSAAERGAGNNPKDPCIKLIDLTIAAADADETFYSAAGENTTLATHTVPGAKGGYWYVALLTDRSMKGEPEMTYKLDTGGTPTMGKVHNTSQFGFVAVPDSPSMGKYVFMVNENNTIFRNPTSGRAMNGATRPPGVKAIPDYYLHFPADAYGP